MIIPSPPRIGNAGGFLDSNAIDVEHMQKRRFVASRMRADLTERFLVQMERYLEGGVVTPEADAVLRRIVISAWIRKMEGHQCSQDSAQPSRRGWSIRQSGGRPFIGAASQSGRGIGMSRRAFRGAEMEGVGKNGSPRRSASHEIPSFTHRPSPPPRVR